MNRTSIEWTEFSANPLKYRDADGRVVWACVHASPGCKNCYSETIATRYRRGGPFNVPTMAGLTPFLDDAVLHKMLTAKRVDGLEVAGRRCFPFDMTDLFGEWVPDEIIDRVFAVFALRPDVTWQVLTKRAERMRAYMADEGLGLRLGAELMKAARGHAGAEAVVISITHQLFVERRPLPNVWLGVSVENQRFADERIPLLLHTPAAIRFISAEPLLGPINLRGWANPGWACPRCHEYQSNDHEACRKCGAQNRFNDTIGRLDWVIVGGESGRGARQFDLEWARSIVEQCKSSGLPVFVKQMGSNAVVRNDEHDEGWPGCTVPLDDDYEPRYQGETAPLVFRKKGGEPSEWPEDLRVREFPRVATCA